MNSNTPQFIHLKNHTEYSLVDGLIRVNSLVKEAKKLNMPAVAVTDHTNLFATVKFYRSAIGSGVKPIVGADVLIKDTADQKTPYLLTLLVQNREGYLGLSELISDAYLDGQEKGIAYLTSEQVLSKNAGLIALSGAMDGEIGQHLLGNNQDVANKTLEKWVDAFGNRFYIELQRVGKQGEQSYVQQAIELASRFTVPVVATNGNCFIRAEEFDAHEARVCINQGRVLGDPRRVKNHTPQQYFKSAEEMQALFEDLPEAIENTVHIAQRCNIELTLGKNYLPDFPIPAGLTIDQYIGKLAEEGLQKRISETAGRIVFDEVTTRVYQERLKRELDVICQMGFPGYFLIVADFIQWAKDNACLLYTSPSPRDRG